MIERAASPDQAPASLVVFSDDWGRHPSSCQHLVRRLLPNYRVLWVNTIGTRAPRFDLATARRIMEKLKQWLGNRDEANTECQKAEPEAATEHDFQHPNLTVVNPRMWPWFSHGRDRRLNRWLLTRQLSRLIEQLPQPVTAVTTLPITADLVDTLPVEKWLYYCVDDFSQWPGLDGETLRHMDCDMIRGADQIVAVSEHLQEMISREGCSSSLLTHGVDLEHWRTESTVEPECLRGLDGPVAVFWGVVDRRLDTEKIVALSRAMTDGTILLVGPQQDPDPAVLELSNVRAVGAQPFHVLPALARAAQVLIMPYADLPVTRAMQPLKMKEYLATGRPVVVSRLPAVEPWADCMDVTDTPEEFAADVLQRFDGDVPADQRAARERLNAESWDAKAVQFEDSLQIHEQRPAVLPLRTYSNESSLS